MRARPTTLYGASLALAMAVLSLRPFYESDLFWHLGLGRAVLREGARTVNEPWALPGVFAARCVVPEWLWDVATWLLYGAAGYAGLHALIALCAAGSAACITWLARDRRDEIPWLAFAPVSALATWLAFTRVRERPESAAMVLLPLCMIAGLRVDPIALATQRTSTVVRTLASRVALALVWAQLHPSAVLAPLVFACATLPRATGSRRALALVAAATVAIALATCTGSHGFGLYGYALLHTHGDAVRHVADVAAPTWDFFDPTEKTIGPAFLLLVLISVGGAAARRRVDATHALLGLTGVALGLTARRGVGPGAILLVPCAMDGATALAARMPARGRRAMDALGVVLACAIVAFCARWIDETRGPISREGTTPGRFPVAGLAALARLPQHSAVLTSFNAGAYVGFVLDGYARTYVDSRTPMYFDDVDYAVARVVWADAAALDRATRRYGFAAAVVERSDPSCPTLARASDWYPAAVEAGFTTFVHSRERTRAITHVAPCEDDYVVPARCSTPDDADALDHEIAQLAASGADAHFVSLLRAERVVACGPSQLGPDAVAAMIPDAASAWSYGAARDRLLARVRIAQGRVADARALVEPWIARGDATALALIVPSLARTDPDGLRRILSRALERMDDAAPARLRATLAASCAMAGETDCVRMQALRAAAMGDVRAGPALCWLESRHGDARVRRDARAWRDALSNEPGADLAQLTCPGPLLGHDAR